MKTILVSAYAVNPYKGSEDGMGWNFIGQIARFNKVIAITRENTRANIERYMLENPAPYYTNIQFVYYDLPYWMRFWKKGSRGALLYYYMWQYGLPFFVRSQKLDFDIVHNLNFHNDWTPSRLWTLQKPFVWGPIGHHSQIPKDFVIHVYGRQEYLIEKLKWATKNYFWRIDPLLRQTVRHADAVLAMNSSVARVLPLEGKEVFHMPSVSSEMPKPRESKSKDNRFTVLSAGRFVPLKGFDITIKSFARFWHQLPVEHKPFVQLVLVGDGPEKNKLIRMIADLKIEEAVEIIKWLPRVELTNLYREADVFLFPSHEGAGMVVAEALSFKLPVLCFRNDGPGEFVDESCGITIPYSRYDEALTRFSLGLKALFSNRDLLAKLSTGAEQRFKEKFDWNLKGEQLNAIYEKIGVKGKSA